MRVDATIAQLRPRPMLEAADLGIRLVQASARPLLAAALPVYVAAVLLCLALTPLAPWLPTLALWCLKPWLDRTVLWVLSRTLFRQPADFATLWTQRHAAWWQGTLAGWMPRRLSPWRSFTQPVRQLEGLRGAALRKRRRQLLGPHQGTALMLTTAFAHLELALFLGLPALVLWLVPGGEMADAFGWFRDVDEGGLQVLGTLAYALAMGLVEPFYVGAGFAMYLNRRVELEAWDVEQALRHAFPQPA